MIEKRGGGTSHAAATRTAWWHVVHGEEHHESASDATAGRKWPLWIRSLDVDDMCIVFSPVSTGQSTILFRRWAVSGSFSSRGGRLGLFEMNIGVWRTTKNFGQLEDFISLKILNSRWTFSLCEENVWNCLRWTLEFDRRRGISGGSSISLRENRFPKDIEQLVDSWRTVFEFVRSGFFNKVELWIIWESFLLKYWTISGFFSLLREWVCLYSLASDRGFWMVQGFSWIGISSFNILAVTGFFP